MGGHIIIATWLADVGDSARVEGTWGVPSPLWLGNAGAGGVGGRLCVNDEAGAHHFRSGGSWGVLASIQWDWMKGANHLHGPAVAMKEK